MIARNHILQIELIEKTVLPTYRLAHHRPDPLAPSSQARNHDRPSPSKDFFNTLGYKQTLRPPPRHVRSTPNRRQPDLGHATPSASPPTGAGHIDTRADAGQAGARTIVTAGII